MPLARLLAAGLLLCTLPALCQEPPKSPRIPGDAQLVPVCKTAEAGPSEPWRIIPNDPGDLRRAQKLQDCPYVHRTTSLGQDVILYFTPDPGTYPTFVSPDGQLSSGNMCYLMRSYVVERDAKNSDSTHPAGYSTCQPASRFRLKNADSPGRAPR